MNTDAQVTKDDVLKRGRKKLLIVHGILLVLLLLVLYLVTPVFAMMFSSFSGQLPYPTRIGISVGDFVKHYPLLVALLFVALLWLDAQVYTHLYNRYGERAGRWWYLGVFAVLVLLTVGCVLVMYLPIFRMCGEIP